MNPYPLTSISRHGRGNKVQVNATRVTSMVDGGTSIVNDSNSLPGISKGQWMMVMEMLKPNRNEERLSDPYDEWIMDPGASHYMTRNIKLLREVHAISPFLIGLENGESTFAVKEGNLALEGNAFLCHVLFVPHLNCTLLFV